MCVSVIKSRYIPFLLADYVIPLLDWDNPTHFTSNAFNILNNSFATYSLFYFDWTLILYILTDYEKK